MAKKLLSFIHISDTHLHPDPNYIDEMVGFSSQPPVEKLIHYINTEIREDIDFVMHTGDVVHHPESPEHYHAAKKILDQLLLPVYYIPGNHDDVAMFQKEFLGVADEDIKTHFDYEFERNGVQFVMVDSHNVPGIKDGRERATGVLQPEQVMWLQNVLNPNDPRPLVVGVHHHALPLESPWLDGFMLRNGHELHNSLRLVKNRLRGVFYGHIHENVMTMRDGINYFSAPSAWFQTNTWYGAEDPKRDPHSNPGFNLVTITETDTFVRFIRIPLEPKG